MQALPDDALTLTPWKSSFLSRLFLAIRRDLSIVNAVKVAKVGKVFKIPLSQILFSP